MSDQISESWERKKYFRGAEGSKTTVIDDLEMFAANKIHITAQFSLWLIARPNDGVVLAKIVVAGPV